MKFFSAWLLLAAAPLVQGQNATNTTGTPIANETMVPTTMAPTDMVENQSGNTTNTTNDMIVTLVPLNSTQPPGNIFDQNNNGLTETDGNITTTMAPTSNTTMAPTLYVNTQSNQICQQLDPGDVFVYFMASDDPDGIGFLALEDIPGPMTLLLTDNPWMGNRFGTAEGVLSLPVPATGLPARTNFGYGNYGQDTSQDVQYNWTREDGNFNYGVNGDSFFLYCEGINGTVNPLVGFSNFGDGSWAEPGLSESAYGAGQSALPVELQSVGSVGLPHFDNYEYKGPSGDVNKTALQAAMMDPENWEGEDPGLGDSSAIRRTPLLRQAMLGLVGAMAAILL